MEDIDDEAREALHSKGMDVFTTFANKGCATGDVVGASVELMNQANGTATVEPDQSVRSAVDAMFAVMASDEQKADRTQQPRIIVCMSGDVDTL